MKFTLETLREIHNDEDGSRYEVGPDRDGLDCVELRYRNLEGQFIERMTFPPDLAYLIADALIECGQELEKPKKK